MKQLFNEKFPCLDPFGRITKKKAHKKVMTEKIHKPQRKTSPPTGHRFLPEAMPCVVW